MERAHFSLLTSVMIQIRVNPLRRISLLLQNSIENWIISSRHLHGMGVVVPANNWNQCRRMKTPRWRIIRKWWCADVKSNWTALSRWLRHIIICWPIFAVLHQFVSIFTLNTKFHNINWTITQQRAITDQIPGFGQIQSSLDVRPFHYGRDICCATRISNGGGWRRQRQPTKCRRSVTSQPSPETRSNARMDRHWHQRFM